MDTSRSPCRFHSSQSKCTDESSITVFGVDGKSYQIHGGCLSRILVLPQKHQEELPSFSSFDIPYSRDNRVNTGPRSWIRRRNYLAETATALGCQSCHKMSTGLLPWCSFPESSVLLWKYQNKQSQDTKMCQLGWVRFAQNHETTKYLFTDRPTDRKP